MSTASVHSLDNIPPVAVGTPGVADARWLPDTSFDDAWNEILMPGDTKARLARQAAATMLLRRDIAQAFLPLHGIVLLAGVPGTGKTTVARGLASRVAASVSSHRVAYIEVDPHELTSSSLGRSQRAVDELFNATIMPVAQQHVTVVLLDEVETLATDRAGLSRDANPIDVHRATDAALTNLDRLAATCPDVLVIATTNFDEAVDDAFVSRADIVHRFAVPDADARAAILENTIRAIDAHYPGAASVITDPKFRHAIDAGDGLDGRTLRKAVAAAAAMAPDLDFAALTPDHLIAAITAAREFRQ